VFGIHDLWLFVLSALLLNITPGPDTLYIVGRSASQGLRAGAFAALGIGTGALVHVSAAALGLSAILAASATAFTAVKFVGAAYLLYVGVGLLRSSGTAHSAMVVTEESQLSTRQLSMRGVF
jgi:threonine/homoserine/homoserine lactone efflux protein